MASTTQHLSRIVCHLICYVAGATPPAILLGTAFALKLPLDNHLVIVAAILLIMSSAITVIMYRTVFQEAHLGRIATFVALGYILSRAPGLVRTSSLGGEFMSCLKEYIGTMAFVSFTIAMMVPETPRRKGLSCESAASAVQFSLPDAISAYGWPSITGSAQLAWDTASQEETLKSVSDLGSLYYREMGPGSSCSLPSDGNESVLSLSSAHVMNPILVMEIVRMETVMSVSGAGDSSERTVWHEQGPSDASDLYVSEDEPVHEVRAPIKC